MMVRTNWAKKPQKWESCQNFSTRQLERHALFHQRFSKRACFYRNYCLQAECNKRMQNMDKRSYKFTRAYTLIVCEAKNTIRCQHELAGKNAKKMMSCALLCFPIYDRHAAQIPRTIAEFLKWSTFAENNRLQMRVNNEDEVYWRFYCCTHSPIWKNCKEVG